MDDLYEVWKQILICLPVFSRISLKQNINRIYKVQMSRKTRHNLLNLNNKYLGHCK